jgi:two-component system, NtrC family, sensor kinase
MAAPRPRHSLLGAAFRRWREAPAIVRAEALVASWEIFSALVFISAVVPAAFDTPWPRLIFAGGLALSAALARRLVRRGRPGIAVAAGLRTIAWLAAVTPVLTGGDLRVLVASCGFGLMAGGMRRAAYRRLLDPLPARAAPVRLRADVRELLAENAMVAGIAGGHVLLLFSVAFLRTQSQVVFRAWWEIIPVLAILGTVGFTVAVRPTTDRVLEALRLGPNGDRERLLAGLRQAKTVPRKLALVNFVTWVVCTSIGTMWFRPAPSPLRWSPADAVMQIAFGSLFAWGVSFHQRGWNEDTMAPVVTLLGEWTGEAGDKRPLDLRRRMLLDFGLPLAFVLALSLLSSIGLYRTLAWDLTLRDDFNSIAALTASFGMLVLAVGGLFMRAASRLSDPLGSLARAADEVASGRLEEAVPRVEGPAEVVGLGRSIEHMRRALARTIAELKEEQASLEVRVSERTAELEQALEELKQAQTALIQGERMKLIGELVANVAHEIYNPLNAIAGSIGSLERIAGELDAMVHAYREHETLLPESARRALEKRQSELDVSGALEDLAGVVKVVRSATRRSVEIVTSLKSFARAPAEPIPSDIHAGLAETLGLLRHRLDRAGVRVVTRYGDIDLVTCRAGEINQVFMNLLTNAIQALAAHDPRGDKIIEVRTEASDGAVRISISDSGPGVPMSLRGKIFDPFFTTKERDGTGLGLSISREIVRRHGGSIALAAEGDGAAASLGGACFIVTLPSRGYAAVRNSIRMAEPP